MNLCNIGHLTLIFHEILYILNFIYIKNYEKYIRKELYLLTLDDFIKNNYQKYLSKSQREYLLEHKKFRDKKAVQKQLSRYFERVSIKMRGRTLVIAMGQPRIKVEGDKLKDALTKKIALRYDPNKLQSFSWWVWQLNIDINHEKISFEDTKEKKIYAITKELVENKQMAWFQSAFNAFSKRVGNGYILIPYCAESVADKYGSGEHIEVRPLDHYERFEVRRLKEDLEEKGLRDPRMQRESKEWEDLLARLGLVNIYNVYEVAGLKEDELSSLRENQGVVTFDARNLFITKFDSWISKKIKEFYKDEGIKSAVDAGIISGSNSGLKYPTIKEWVQFKPLIFRDSVSEKLLDEVKYMDSDDLFKMFGIDEEE